MSPRGRWRWAAGLLILVGCGAMVADLCGLRSVKGLLTAWGCSVQPRVFSTVDGLETFSSTVVVRLKRRDGEVLETPLTKRLARKLRGPYNRRNVYGAILVYGPVLQQHPQLGPMMDAILEQSAREGSPLLRDFAVSARDVAEVEVELIPKHPSRCAHLKLTRTMALQEAPR
jgi:hypothetical protein